MDSQDHTTTSGLRRRLIWVLSLAWALFQLSLPSILILDSTATRAVHLAFALSLLFLTRPLFTRVPKVVRGAAKRLGFLDWGLAALGVVTALYVALDQSGIMLRSGMPNTQDLLFGISLIVIVLEASRRAVGPALPVIAVVFIAYAFLGPYLPMLFAFRGVSVSKFVTQISLSTEGIYGIPLGVSAQIVFLFVLMGAILEKAGAGQFFITLALSVLGRFRGGPAKAAVAASGLMGGISGSSIANIVTTGTFTIPLMKKVGYPAKKAAATEVAASTDGQLMPPIMGAAAFIIAEYVNVPYIAVVKAAFVPAFISYCALFYITHLEACKLGLNPLPKADIPEFWSTMKSGWHFLVAPVLLIFELLVLRRSAEHAVFTTIMVLVPIVFYEQFLRGRREGARIGKVLKRSARVLADGCVGGSKNMVSVALATAAAGIIVGIINMGIGSMITQIVEVLSGGNIFLLLAITAIASLLLGMGLPTTATYIVMASLTAPILVQVGAQHGYEIPLIATHLFCFYFGILADDTPPVGLASYAAAAIAESEPIPTGIQGFLYDLRTTIIPFMFIFNTNLILYGVTSWIHGAWIFISAAFAACMFTSAVQGWFVRKNRWFETLLLLVSAVLLFNPRLIRFMGIGEFQTVAGYIVGFLLIGTVYAFQKVNGETAVSDSVSQ